MSISTGVIVAVAFQKVDSTPDTKTCTESYYQSLQNTDCAVEKCHKVFLLDLPAYMVGMMKWKLPRDSRHVHLQEKKGIKISGADDQSVPDM